MFTHTEYRIGLGTGFRHDGSAINQADRESALSAIEQAMVSVWGGFTRHDAKGGWRGPDGVVIEDGITYRILVSHNTNPDTVRRFAISCGRALSQAAIVVACGEQAMIQDC